MEAEKRTGCLTSSEIYKLIPMGSAPMNEVELAEFKKLNPKSRKRNKSCGFSDLGKTYIKTKRVKNI